MPKTKISEFSATPGNNTDIDGINIAEGCSPSGINDAIRELMAQLKDFQAGTAGDSFNGPVGTTTAAAGAFTNLSASGTFALTGDQVQISEGGTGQTTANAAFNALAPSQATHAGKYLKTDGTNTSWDALDISTADITGTLPVANGGTGVTSSTGTGSVVLSASPTFTGTVNAAALTLSGAATLNGGTANGVAYLNGSKVLTTGSALTFDGTNLSTGSGSFLANGTTGITSFRATTTSNYAELQSRPDISYSRLLSSAYLLDIATLANQPILFTVNSSEQMRLTSTGLGIGTTSINSRLVVQQANNTGDGIRLFANGNDSQLLTRYVASIDAWQVSASYASTGAYKPIAWFTSDVERMRLDSSGNLGLGVTPGAWTTYRAMDIGGGQSVFSYQDAATNTIGFAANALWNGSWVYRQSSVGASRYQLVNNAHSWYTAPSGTAGNAISFTQAMTLDASGNLGLGTTTPTNSGGYSTLSLNGSTGGQLVFQTGGTYRQAIYSSSTDLNFYNQAAGNLAFFTNATERARITSGGNLLVGTTTNNASGGVIQVSNGITFPATQSASSDANTLDDYEEGTWTPVLRDSSANQATMTLQQGFYTKIGNVVYAWCQVSYSSKTAMTGTWYAIAGLPFTAKTNTGNYYYGGVVQSDTSTSDVISLIAGGDSMFVFSASNSYTLQQVSALSASGRIIVTATYVV